MKTIVFQGLPIRIENPAGSTRSGIDNNGKPWSVVMAYPYGEIIGSKGIDGDPVDVFLGNNKSAKFVYVVHQLTKTSGEFDEDKVFMGFNDVMDVKSAFFKNYDIPSHFWSGDVSVIPVKDFKKKVMQTKTQPQLIRASKMENAIQLYAQAPVQVNPFKIGDQVTVDGMHGRGIVYKVNGRRVTIQFRNRMYLSRDFIFVHSLNENTVSKMWRS
jgi:inorganic pyrophosphatase-like protein